MPQDIRMNCITAHNEIIERVRRCSLTQVGNVLQLENCRADVLRHLEIIISQSHNFSEEELDTLRYNMELLFQRLDSAITETAELAGRAAMTVSHREKTGGRGRPRVAVDIDLLGNLLELRGPTGLASIFQCSARTLRRIALAAGLVEPGDPVFRQELGEDGVAYRVHTSTTRRTSNLSDDNLDQMVASILEQFPTFGRQYMEAALNIRGHYVPSNRIADSLVRVRGAPRPFGRRPGHNRVYTNKAPMHVVHHDGQHGALGLLNLQRSLPRYQTGLIRWKIVIHLFVDGFSRLVVGLRAHDNNRAMTVLDLFLEEVVGNYGVPTRVRGDHGVENVLVAEYMHEVRGSDTRPYLWGPSKDNTRAERPWYEVTESVGLHWKKLFYRLEDRHSLDPGNATHIWLIHRLFLSNVNADLLEWKGVWNAHKMQIKGERTRSPVDMFVFGMIQKGPRGREQFLTDLAARHGRHLTARAMQNGAAQLQRDLDADGGVESEDEDEELDDLEQTVDANGVRVYQDGHGYVGNRDAPAETIDAADVERLMNEETNGLEGIRAQVRGSREANPFVTPALPRSLTRIICDPPYCPLSAEHLALFIEFFQAHIDPETLSWQRGEEAWDAAFRFCSGLDMVGF